MRHEVVQYKAGVQRIPRPESAANGEISIAADIVNDGGGYTMIEKPVKLFELAPSERVLLIHQNGDYKHYIISAAGNNLKWIDSGDNNHVRHDLGTIESSAVTQEIFGNTIVISTASRLYYFLWRADDETYEDLGARPPMPEITFWLESSLGVYPGYASNGEKEKSLHLRHKVKSADLPLPEISDTHSFVPPREMWETHKRLLSLNHIDTSSFNDDFDAFSLSLKGMSGENGTEVADAEVDRITEWAMAGINTFVKQLGEDENKFVMPFFVRYAYEMSDGSLIMHSYPVLLIPNSKGPIFGLHGACDYGDTKAWGTVIPGGDDAGLELDHEKTESVAYGFRGRVYGFVSTLFYRLQLDARRLAKWKDLIRGINVYATPAVYRYKQDGKVYGWTEMTEDKWAGYYGISGDLNRWDQDTERGAIHTLRHAIEGTDLYTPYRYKTSAAGEVLTYNHYPSYVMTLDMRERSEMRGAYERAAQYYKIGGWSFDDLTISASTLTKQGPLEMEDGTLATLAAREKMSNDDYYSHDNKAAGTMYDYNHRLNIANITRAPHNPLAPQLQFANVGDITTITERVKITSAGTSSVVATTGQAKFAYPHFVFYPDPSARQVWLTIGDTTYEVKLTPHPYLHGAYWLGDVDRINTGNQWSTTGLALYATNKPISMPAVVMTSAPDNPFVFNPDNTVEVAEGQIIALRAAVTALSQGQFGGTPMYAFTTRGVWALQPNKTGGWADVQSVSRDVAISTPVSIDNAVLLTTRRGIVMLAGSKSNVLSTDIDAAEIGDTSIIDKLMPICDSQISRLVKNLGERPNWFNAAICYDYKHRRVYISPADRIGTWVLNLRNMAFTHTTTGVDMELNSYPQCEYVSDGVVYSLDDDARKSHGLLVTRPLQTGLSNFARVRDVYAHGRDIAGIVLFGTRDYNDYAVTGSAYGHKLTRHGGSGYKAHVLALLLDGDNASTDRATLEIDTLGKDKMRLT